MTCDSTSRATRNALFLAFALAVASGPATGAGLDRIASFSAGDPPTCRDAVPDLAVQPGGTFLLLWQQTECPTPPTSTVRALRFDAAGRRLGPAIELWRGSGPQIAPLPDGGFVAISGGEPDLAPPFQGIGLHRLDALGRPVGEPITVAVDRFAPSLTPRLAVAPNGAVAVVWQVVSVNPLFPARVVGRFFNPALEPTSEAFSLSNGPTFPGQFEPEITFQADGTALALWEGTFRTLGPQIYGRVFDGSGHPLTDDFPVSLEAARADLTPRAVARAGGGWWVGWYDDPLPFPPPPGPDPGDTEGRVVRLGPRGERLGAEQSFGPLPLPGTPLALGTGPSGDLLVLAVGLDGSISGRRFGSDGAPSSNAFSLTSAFSPSQPALAKRSSGAFVAAWSGASATSGFDTDLFGAIFTPTCLEGKSAVCLGPEGRYAVEVTWKVGTESGTAKPLPLAGNAATFGLRNAADHEVTVVVSGPGSRDFTFAATTGAALEIRVTDKPTGMVRTFSKPAGRFLSQLFGFALPGLASGSDTSLPAPSAPGATESESVVPTLPAVGETCIPSRRSLCLLGGRFRAEFFAGQSQQPAFALSRTDKSGAFAVPSAPETPRVLLTMIDGRASNGKFWVYLGGLSPSGYKVKITDLTTGATKTYTNLAPQLESRADRTAF